MKPPESVHTAYLAPGDVRRVRAARRLPVCCELLDRTNRVGPCTINNNSDHCHAKIVRHVSDR